MTEKASNMANDISDITLGLQKEWFNQALTQQKAVYEATLKMWSRFFAVPKVIDRARDVKVGTTPSEIVYEEDTLRLLRYRRETPAVYAEPVVVCYGSSSTGPTSWTCKPTGASSGNCWPAASTSI